MYMEKPSRSGYSINRILASDAADPYRRPEVEDMAPLSPSGVFAGIIDFDSLTLLPDLVIPFQAGHQPTTQWIWTSNMPLRTT